MNQWEFHNVIDHELDRIEAALFAAQPAEVKDRATRYLSRSDVSDLKKGYVYYILGWTELRIGAATAARDAFGQVAALSPGSVEAQIGLGRVLILVKQYEQAEKLLSQALGHPTSDARALTGLALLYEQSGKFTRAWACCEEALTHDPTNDEALGLLYTMGTKLGKLEEVEARAQRALEIDPIYTFARCILVMSLFVRGRQAQAKEALARVQLFLPESALTANLAREVGA